MLAAKCHHVNVKPVYLFGKLLLLVSVPPPT